jgi:hypothetical protein
MPAQSKAQQRFFGVVKAMQKGDKPKEGEAGKVAKSMKKKDVDDFASTKHKGKPEKVKREMKVRSLIKKMVREELQENMCFDLQTERCWKGYTQKGMKKMFGKMYPNCVKIKKKKSENVAPNHDGKAAPYGSGWKKTNQKKERKLKEDFKNNEWEVYVADDPYGKNQKVVKRAKSKRAAVILYNKLIKTDKYFEVGMRVVKEGKLSEKKFIPTVTIEKYNNVVMVKKFKTEKDADKFIKQFNKKNQLKRKKGFWGNPKTGVELFRNF